MPEEDIKGYRLQRIQRIGTTEVGDANQREQRSPMVHEKVADLQCPGGDHDSAIGVLMRLVK
jgi:hypothetical protein